MKPSGNETVVFFQHSRLGFFFIGCVGFAFELVILYVTWIQPIGPDGSTGRYGGPVNYYILKFFGVPLVAYFVVHCFQMALNSSKEIAELRVGAAGIWKRAMYGKEHFVSWEEITEIRITASSKERLLLFSLRAPSKFSRSILYHGGVYLKESSSPEPLEVLAQKLGKFSAFSQRFSAKHLEA